MNNARTPSLRGVTFGKLRRDARNILRYARFVIVLGGDYPKVIDNGYRRTKSLPYARIIAVVGPVQHTGIILKNGVRMEIGYSRTRPYAQLEERLRDEYGNRGNRRWFLKPRPRAGHLSDEEFALVFPLITQCMASIVLEHRQNWKVKKSWWVDGPGEVERGVHFTIHHSDESMFRQMVLEDVRYRRERYISRHAAWVYYLLKRYKYSAYPSRQLRKFSKAQCVAEMLSQGHYTPFYRAVFLRCFAKGSHTRTLLDSIMETFGIDVSLSEREEYVLDHAPTVPKLVDLQCYRPPRQPIVHARESSVFEITLERRYREKNEIPF